MRSVAAARRATELGLQAYNILQGFEGDADAQAQRGHVGGWRLHGLPWLQNKCRTGRALYAFLIWFQRLHLAGFDSVGVMDGRAATDAFTCASPFRVNLNLYPVPAVPQPLYNSAP